MSALNQKDYGNLNELCAGGSTIEGILGRPFELKSPAKVNLTLRVGCRYPNGYHAISTVICPINLFDTITISVNLNPGQVTCHTELSPDLERNIASYRSDLNRVRTELSSASNLASLAASSCLQEWDKEKRYGVEISIKKNIPLEAGLGGGSSNAATVIQFLAQFFGGKGDGQDRSEVRSVKSDRSYLRGNSIFSDCLRLGAKLGSDIPAILAGELVYAHGTGGEIIDIVCDNPEFTRNLLGSFEVVIIKPVCGVSTAWAYSQLQRKTTPVPDNLGGLSRNFQELHLKTLDSLGCRLADQLPSGPINQVKDSISDLTSIASNGISGVRKSDSSEASTAVAGVCPVSGDSLARRYFLESLFNDFEAVVLEQNEVVAQAVQVATDLGAERVLLCGSGSSVLCLGTLGLGELNTKPSLADRLRKKLAQGELPAGTLVLSSAFSAGF